MSFTGGADGAQFHVEGEKARESGRERHTHIDRETVTEKEVELRRHSLWDSGETPTAHPRTA